MTTNIFQILAAVNRRDGITLEQAQHLERVTRHLSYRHIIDTLEQRTPNVPWLCCDGSGLYFPDYQEARTVGQLDGDTYFLPYLQHNEGSDYQQARDRHGDVGYTTDSDAIWVDCENEYITQDYYERGDFGYCGACGEVFQTNDLYWREHNEETYCESCDPGPEEEEDDEDDNGRDGYHPPHNINNGGIYNYSRKVEEVIPVDLTKGVRYFGIELEQEFPGETPSYWADWAMSRFSLLREVAIWKADGSLSEGAELVSVPQTLSVWQSTEDNPIRDLCNDREWRKVARSHKTTTCGLHVHVSRDTIPEPVIAKLVVLLNDDSMRELTTLVARRAPNTTYCMASKKKWHSSPSYSSEGSPLPAWARARTGYSIPKRQYTQGSRYTPVNITDHTLEFRIFRGTLKWETILASIEFCDAVISYCTQHGAGAMNSTAFRRWLTSAITRKTYPALRDYLELRCVLPKRKAKPDIVTDDIVSEPEAPPATFVMDPYEGSREEWHFSTHNSPYYVTEGAHYIAFFDHPVPVVGSMDTLIHVAPGEIWWNSTRTCSLRVEPSRNNSQI